jgi:hypothetical protein
MEPVSAVAVITAVLPFVTAFFKKILKTDQWGPRKSGWNALIPVVLGVASSGVYAYAQGTDVVSSIAIGLGSGGAASSARDIDKNLINLFGAIRTMAEKEDTPKDEAPK